MLRTSFDLRSVTPIHMRIFYLMIFSMWRLLKGTYQERLLTTRNTTSVFAMWLYLQTWVYTCKDTSRPREMNIHTTYAREVATTNSGKFTKLWFQVSTSTFVEVPKCKTPHAASSLWNSKPVRRWNLLFKFRVFYPCLSNATGENSFSHIFSVL
jgi:hypothetical protein